MTKKGYMPKLVACLLGMIMCLCASTLIFGGAATAKAEGEEDLPLMTLEEVDEFATVGYKVTKESGTYIDPTDNTEYTYDYKFTLTKGNEIYHGGGTRYMINNSEPFVFNVTTADGYKLYESELISTSGWEGAKGGIMSTDESFGCLVPLKRAMPTLTLEMPGAQKIGKAYTEAWINTTDDGGTLVTGKLRLLIERVEVLDNEYLFTGAINDKNGNKNGMWLTFGANDVLGVSTADGEWTRAEVFIDNNESGNTNIFFQNVYFLEEVNIESLTAESLEAALSGRDLYTLMTGERFVASNGLAFKTEVRDDHIEIYKETKNELTDREALGVVNFEEGDAFYFGEGLKMIGKNSSGNWTIASEGGSANVLKRSQFFYFDGENWSIDQFSMDITLDKKSELIETGNSITISANVETGKFVTGSDTAVTWTSEDESVATVDAGVVTAVAAGDTTIKATLSDGTVATCSVSVVSATEIKDITLDKRNHTLYTGNENNTYTFTATTTGGSQRDTSVTWTSSNEEVATVDENGKVTAVSEGNATITATAADGVHKATAMVNVLEAEEENPAPGPGGNDIEKPGESEEGCGCGGSVAGTVTMAGAALMLGAAAILALRKKRA